MSPRRFPGTRKLKIPNSRGKNREDILREANRYLDPTQTRRDTDGKKSLSAKLTAKDLREYSRMDIDTVRGYADFSRQHTKEGRNAHAWAVHTLKLAIGKRHAARVKVAKARKKSNK